MDLMNKEITMTSREIAELTNVRHDNVIRTIKTLVTRMVITLPQIEEKPTAGRPSQIYVFEGEQGKRDSLVLVAQLSPEFTGVLVDRWQELEKILNHPQQSPTLSSFEKQLTIAEVAGRMLRMAESSKLGMLHDVAKRNGVDSSFLPSYSIDAPESTISSGSSIPTKAITSLLKDYDVGGERNGV